MTEALKAALLEKAMREKKRRSDAKMQPVTSQESIDKANRIAEDRMTIADAGVPTGFAVKGLQGLPFVGEWVDEAYEAVIPGSGERIRNLQGAMDREYPKTAIAAELTGGIVGSAPLAIGATGTALNAATRTGRVLRGAAIGMAAGAAEGAVAGAGREKRGDRRKGAARGALIGGGLGAVIGGITPLAGEALISLTKRVKKLDVRTIAEELGISAPAARTVKQALINDDLDAAAAALARVGDDGMLADAGQASASLLDAASATGGAALRTTREAVEGRAESSGKRLATKLDDILGPADGVRAAARDISRRTSATRQAAYTRAYSQPIDYSGAGRNIEEVLARIPPNTLNSAISEANDAMRAAGVRNRQIMAQIGADGSVVFREMPNVQQLDEIKKALGKIARDEVDQFGRKTAPGIRATQLAADLRDAVAAAVPDYSRAVKLGGDKIAEDTALDLGRSILSRRTTFEDVRDVMRGASVEARAAVQRGLRENIEATLSEVRRTITDPNVDAREAMTLVKQLSSRANQKKVRLAIGSKANELFRELDRAEAALALRAAVARNSATAQRQAIQGQVRAETQPGLIRRTLGKGGNPLEGAREITETLAGIDPASIGEREKAIFDEIAQALTGIRGQDAQQALQVIRAAMQGQPIKDADARRIGQIIAGAGAGASYQGSSRTLSTPQPR